MAILVRLLLCLRPSAAALAAVGVFLFPLVAHAAEAAAAAPSSGWSDILPRIIEIVSPFLVAALAWAGAKFAGWLGTKTKNEYLQGLMLRLNEGVFTAVKGVQQSYVDAIKRGRADGHLSDVEKKAAVNQALGSLKSYLGPKGLDELGKVLGLDGLAVDQFLGDKIEAAVHDLRASTKAAPGGAPLASPSAQ